MVICERFIFAQHTHNNLEEIKGNHLAEKERTKTRPFILGVP